MTPSLIDKLTEQYEKAMNIEGVPDYKKNIHLRFFNRLDDHLDERESALVNLMTELVGAFPELKRKNDAVLQLVRNIQMLGQDCGTLVSADRCRLQRDEILEIYYEATK